MGKEMTGDNVSGCSSNNATCEHAPGIVCLNCARARSKTEKLSATRETASRMRDACLESYSDLTSTRVQTDTMNNRETSVHCVHTGTNTDTDEYFSDLSPADLPSLFLTTVTTCSAGQVTSSQMSWKMSHDLLAESTSCMSKRRTRFCEMCSRMETRSNRSSQNFKTSICLMLILASLSRLTAATMDITAFEYQRKFHKQLSLGECSQREITVERDNNTFSTERCTLQQRGIVTHYPRQLNDSRNVLITSAENIVAYLGLCGGEAASFLGILNSGDCVAVEIASQLTFSDKTMVRGFVGYYRKSMDTLEVSSGVIDGMDRYYKDKFYLKNCSYGTLETIFIQFRFESVVDTNEAKKIELSTPSMSKYMRQIENKICIPKSVIVINLSTATQKTFELKQFKKDHWERAVRYVEIKELTIEKTKDQINTNVITPHLLYQLHPFLDTGDFRLTKPVHWEETSMLEVQLQQTITLAKKTAKKCRKNKTKLCRRVRELRRKLISVQKDVHTNRANWVNLTTEERNSFALRYTTRVNSYSSVTKTLARNVREMRTKEKLERLERKRNRLNQIPVNTETPPPPKKRPHRIRHARSRSKNKVKGGQGK